MLTNEVMSLKPQKNALYMYTLSNCKKKKKGRKLKQNKTWTKTKPKHKKPPDNIKNKSKHTNYESFCNSYD
jgi:hypothetical protein